MLGLLRRVTSKYYDPAARMLNEVQNNKKPAGREQILHDAYCRHQFHVRSQEAPDGKLNVLDYMDLEELMAQLDIDDNGKNYLW